MSYLFTNILFTLPYLYKKPQDNISSTENGIGILENSESRSNFEEDISVSNFKAANSKLKVLNNISLLLFLETEIFYIDNVHSDARNMVLKYEVQILLLGIFVFYGWT
jgi:hypothetical protein